MSKFNSYARKVDEIAKARQRNRPDSTRSVWA